MANRTRRQFCYALGALVAAACARTRDGSADPPPARTPRGADAFAGPPPPVGSRLVLTDAQWRARLTAEQYDVLRDHGTERAFTGAYWHEERRGTFLCAGCGAPLFSSAHKFDSGTGWPSFWQPIEPGRVSERSDSTLGMTRTEVNCARCDGHQGHKFDDGPQPTGLRYCINSVSLVFRAG